MSVEEYLELERDSEVRHEFANGVVHAMTRPTLRHNRIVLNIASRLLEESRGGSRRVYSENAKVRIGDEAGYYPDIMVVCGPGSGDAYYEINPCLIVEQDRPAIERFFRDEKGGEWERGVHFEGGSFPAPCPAETRLSLAEVYEGL